MVRLYDGRDAVAERYAVGVARHIVWACIFTVPASATLAVLVTLFVKAGPLAIVLAILVPGALQLWLYLCSGRGANS